MQPDNRRCALFAAEEGRERGNSTWAGEQGNIEGNLDLFFFFLPPGVDCGTLVWDQRQCETCVLTSSKHVPLTLGSPSGVCYTAVCVCFQVAGLRLVVSSGFWVM